jgi:hypothetical protein
MKNIFTLATAKKVAPIVLASYLAGALAEHFSDNQFLKGGSMLLGGMVAGAFVLKAS